MTDSAPAPAPEQAAAPVPLLPPATGSIPVGELPPHQRLPTEPAASSEERVLRVSGGTDCKKLAVCIAGVIERENKKPVLEFIGAGACQQAIKSIAIANQFLSRGGRFVSGLPIFVHRDLADNHDTTGIQIRLLIHNLS